MKKFLSVIVLSIGVVAQCAWAADATAPSSLPAINGVYLKNTANWQQPYVWAWTDGGNCTQSGNWPGDAMTKYDDTYWKWEAASGTPAKIIFNPGGDNGKTGDLTYTASGVYDCSGTLIGTATGNGGHDNPPTPPTESFKIYFDNTSANWQSVYCYAWTNGASDQNAAWPGVQMTVETGDIYSYSATVSYANVIFNNGGAEQTDDLTAVDGDVYKKDGTHSAYQGGNDPQKPTVTASPGSTTFSDNISVSLSSSPAGTIYYTIDGTMPTTSSSRYSSPLTFTETTTLKAFAVTAENVEGNVVTYTYTKGQVVTPPVGDALNTNYYKVNPDGKTGSNRTVQMTFANQNATGALSHWSDADLIAQGVARDVAQAMKGNHERPIIDSYAIYAAYDKDNLYLGVQMVYTVWDLWGEGKQPGESKPYNMDGRLMWAFDLDPAKSFDGYINGTGAIWNDTGKPGAKFDNGVDAVWIGSTKPGVGTPGFFIPTPDGHASYDAAYCKSSTVSYGYSDGLLPSINEIWGQKEFNFSPEALTGNEGFVDLSGEIAESAHTFYEWEFPLSLLGVTEDHIKNNGIGVMYLDIYGASPIGGTPYDPSYFDNVKGSYSMDPSSSQEKEDEDVITYAPARVGKALNSGVESVGVPESSASVKAGNGELTVCGAAGKNVIVSGYDGAVLFGGIVNSDNRTLEVGSGLYIVNVDGEAFKVVVK